MAFLKTFPGSVGSIVVQTCKIIEEFASYLLCAQRRETNVLFEVYYCGVGCQKKDIGRHRQEDGCGKRQEVCRCGRVKTKRVKWGMGKPNPEALR